MTPQKFKDERLRALVDTTEAIARRRPTVMMDPALGLANSLRRRDALVPILRGLFIHVLTRGRVAESRCAGPRR
jgi:hypothetical protein